MRVSVLGLGGMGTAMVKNLSAAGHEVTVFSEVPGRASALGLATAPSLAEAVKEAQVVLTLDAEDEPGLDAADPGLAKLLHRGAIHLSMAHLDVEASHRLAQAHGEAEQGYVAAPVLGRRGAAASRQLWALVGGAEAHVMRCLPLLESLARGMTRVGERPELAHAVALGGDLLSALLAEGLAEVLAYGEKAGMPPADYLRVLNSALFHSPFLDACGGLMVRRDHEPAIQRMDSALAAVGAILRDAEARGLPMPAAELVQGRLEAAYAAGWGALDLTALAKSCRQEAGLEPGETPDPQSASVPQATSSRFEAWTPEGHTELDIDRVSHFERQQDQVWAWVGGRRFGTRWRHLADVEQAFPAISFHRMHKSILLRKPEGNEATEPVRPRTGPTEIEFRLPVLAPGDEGRQVLLELAEITHFEREQDAVWAWSRGQPHRTFSRDLVDIEARFHQVQFLKIHQGLMLNPETVQSFTPIFGGGARVKLGDDQEFRIGRASAKQLRHLLGM